MWPIGFPVLNHLISEMGRILAVPMVLGQRFPLDLHLKKHLTAMHYRFLPGNYLSPGLSFSPPSPIQTSSIDALELVLALVLIQPTVFEAAKPFRPTVKEECICAVCC